MDYSGDFLQFGISGFYNRFIGYIYLEPPKDSADEWFGFPIYRFRQHDALLFGSETFVSVTPAFAKGIKLSVTYEEMTGRLLSGEYLPFMPQQKVKPEIRYNYSRDKKGTGYVFFNADLVMRQSLVNSGETPTSAYKLFNAGLGIILKTKIADYKLNLAANNLLNEAYYDHLSRFKSLGLLNMGRDISITLKINFNEPLKKNKNE